MEKDHGGWHVEVARVARALVAVPCLIAAPFLEWEWFWALVIAGVIGLAADMAATMARLGRLERRVDQLVP